MTAVFPRAFAVRFGDVVRWDPASFQGIEWHWSPSVMETIGSVLRLRKETVDREKYGFSDLQPVTIHFDGSVDRRKVDGTREYSMSLFHARPGDIVVAKIDLKNGAVGIVPDWENVVVTGHFAVYEPDRTKIVPEYFERIIQATFFNAYLWRNKVGAEGRKEVKLDFFEAVKIPIPALATQHAILAEWQKARQAIVAAEENARKIEAEVDAQFLADLGLTAAPTADAMPKVFAVHWRNIARWGVGVVRDDLARPNYAGARFPIARLSTVIADLENGWSPKCHPRPATDQEWGVLKLGAVSFGVFNPTENKALPTTLKPRPDCEIKAGDMLISRANITRLVGACALVEETPPRLLLCDKIFRAIWRTPETIDKQFLAKVLKIPHVRWQIENKVTGGSPTMKNITKPNLLSLEFPLPPLAVQRRIMEKVAAGRARIARERETARQLARRIDADMEAYLLGAKAVGAS